MNVKITCPCNASFEIKECSKCPPEISCPNCGQILPLNASLDLFKMFESFNLFKDKLLHYDSEDRNRQYSFEINHHF